MSAINNLSGHIVKDGRVVYSEQLEPGLHFAVILMYEPADSQKPGQHSSRLSCDAVMTTGEKHAWGNGVISLMDADSCEKVGIHEKFKPLRGELATKDGFRVWQIEHQHSEFEENGVRLKSRRVRWMVDVPKASLLGYCGL